MATIKVPRKARPVFPKSYISTMGDVRQFFRFLRKRLPYFGHPDDEITPEYGITKVEARKFNRLMDECFTACEKAGKDIYYEYLTIMTKA